MALDLVVVNYHTPDDLERFIASLEWHPGTHDLTLTIVDVDVGHDEHRKFRWGDGHDGHHLDVATNVGYGSACNLGATTGRHRYLALLNADVEITAGSLDACIDAFDEHPDWAILGPRQVDRSRHLRHAGIFGTLAAPTHRGWNAPDEGQYRDVADAITVSGSAYFIRRSVWDELTTCPVYQEHVPAQGAFLPTPHYFEETWCSYHAAAHGHRVIYFGAATLIHQWHQASPVGGHAEQMWPTSQAMFRAACDRHGIPHD